MRPVFKYPGVYIEELPFSVIVATDHLGGAAVVENCQVTTLRTLGNEECEVNQFSMRREFDDSVPDSTASRAISRLSLAATAAPAGRSPVLGIF